MRGKAIALTPARRCVGDLLRAAAQVPSVPVQRRMALGELVAARAACAVRIPWPVLFMKAYAQVAVTMPELRRAYVKLPWPQLYEYPVAVASISVERVHAGENVVFLSHIKNPAAEPLVSLTQRIRRLQTLPLEECSDFQRVLRMGRLPFFLRRPLWWLGLNLGRHRVKHFGTFALSVYSALGAESLHPLTPCTTTLNYGVIGADGQVDVRLVYDHRVLDGATVARALKALEEELIAGMTRELAALDAPSDLAA